MNLSEELEAAAVRADRDGLPMDAKLWRRAAELAKRYEDAPVVDCQGFDDLHGNPMGCLVSAPYDYHGQSVRLVREPARRDG